MSLNPPDRIYLQASDDGEGVRDDETTWCRDRINDNDIPYRREHPTPPDVAKEITVGISILQRLADRAQAVPDGFTDDQLRAVVHLIERLYRQKQEADQRIAAIERRYRDWRDVAGDNRDAHGESHADYELLDNHIKDVDRIFNGDTDGS